MAAALLERETLDREDVELLRDGKELPALVVAEIDQPSLKQEKSAPAPKPDGPVLGTPGAEPAGA